MFTSETFLDHIHHPYHRGNAACPSVESTKSHSSCADQITLQLVIPPDSIIQAAWHQGTGCITSQAAASILCEQIEGKTLEELREFTPEDMLGLLGIQLTPMRQLCALVGFHALRQILAREDDACP